MTTKATYCVTAVRERRWWFVQVAGIENAFTQARRRGQVEPHARDMLSGLLNVDPDAFELAVRLSAANGASTVDG